VLKAQFCPFWNTPISVNAPNVSTEAPAASPSRPSVRFTPLVAEVTIAVIQSRKRPVPTTAPRLSRSAEVSRKSEMDPEAGVSPASFGNCSASRPNTTEIAMVPTILDQPPRPSDCSLRVLRKSSMNPMAPQPTASSRTSMAETEGVSAITSLARK